MRVLWVGDAGVSTGFARCTHTVCDELHKQGHEVTVLAMNFFGNPQIQELYPYELWPAVDFSDGGRDQFGESRLPQMVQRFIPDVIVLLNDPWNVPQYLERMRVKLGGLDKKYEDIGLPPVVGWLAVDGKNNPAEHLNYLAHVVTWTEFAEEELKLGGYTGPSSVVPLGVNHSLFRPMNKADCRAKIIPEAVPDDAFIVGMVGRNQPRKRLDLALSAFGKWIETFNVDNAYLYLHVAPTGEQGCELASVASHFGCAHRLIKATPTVGLGASDEVMPEVYNCFDVMMNTSSGEGFGLPILEAMACGIPCLVPDYSGLGEWVGKAAVKVPCNSTQLNAPLNTQAFTIGGVADTWSIVNTLQAMAGDAELLSEYSSRGMARSRWLPWSKTGKDMVTILERVIEEQPAKEAVTG